ncbi:MAG: hypothetical protein U1F56_14705 [Rubrivivax sp.]
MFKALAPLLAAATLALAASAAGPGADAPALLSQTDLFGADGEPAPGVVAFEPQHPLWSDGADKRRWIRLPAGATIDTRSPDAWRFPPGTQLWKEFRHGTRVETRYMALGRDGRWRFASYRWSADGADALRVDDAGAAAQPVAGAPGGRYDFPSLDDCQACHGGARSPVLGFSAVQLGPQLAAAMQRGWLTRAPRAWALQPPQAPGATEVERAARGYLHGNCAHCHHAAGVPRPLRLALDADGRAAPVPDLARVLRRMGTRDPYRQMPPVGTRHLDAAGLALVQAWADTLTPAPKEPLP